MKCFNELFGIDIPLIQAPMAGVQSWELALAVAEAGALGSLPCAMLNAESIRAAVQAYRDRTRQPINLNFFSHQQPAEAPAAQAAWLKRLESYYNELGLEPPQTPAGASRKPFDAPMADLVSELKPEVVSFHFGLPEPALLDRVRASHSRIIATATTVEEALWLEQQGVDAIIAQGVEAGGHRGMFLTDDLDSQIGTLALVPQLVDATALPIIAAGGIADARGVQAAMSLGASAVQIGTAYLLCDEAKTSPVHRAALQQTHEHPTRMTNVFSGRPARGLANRMTEEVGPIADSAPAFPLASGASAPLRAEAESRGCGDFTPLWAGQNRTGCRATSARELTQALAAGFKPQK
ncbi:nitronate monooxygenase [Marinobacterium sp. AK62]|uniref:Propionate 3-nitronate monooxygenase n=1 Tax=Marinobacterium alkalitolerans TaxID=1542925 RepID=A0ABS3ZBK9_9GAMM|nr:nitronate monooxygenase [Marinobacterium alkalitolerans]MBP0048705.1 nitronate monooxygenase [Marinobacterium alkalitolerans]